MIHESYPTPSPRLDVQVSEYRGVPLIRVRGELDRDSVKHLRPAVDEALLQGASIILLDFGELSYMDSAGLNLVFDATRSLRDKGWLGVVQPNSVVHRLLETAGLTHDPSLRTFEDLSFVALAQDS